jgi:hypothetical protein
LLAAGIVCFILAVGCFMVTVAASNTLNVHEAGDPTRKVKIRFTLILGVAFIVFASLTWQIYSYLFAEHRNVLVNFGAWYVTGFFSQMLLLFKRHQILSTVFDTDWEEVFHSFLVANFGPLLTLHVIWRLFIKKEKNFWEQ